VLDHALLPVVPSPPHRVGGGSGVVVVVVVVVLPPPQPAKRAKNHGRRRWRRRGKVRRGILGDTLASLSTRSSSFAQLSPVFFEGPKGTKNSFKNVLQCRSLPRRESLCCCTFLLLA